jgi:hypothetical protein
MENNVPAGRQHCEQPQTWLNRTSLAMDTLTLRIDSPVHEVERVVDFFERHHVW